MGRLVYSTPVIEDVIDEDVFAPTDSWDDCLDDIADSLDIPTRTGGMD